MSSWLSIVTVVASALVSVLVSGARVRGEEGAKERIVARKLLRNLLGCWIAEFESRDRGLSGPGDEIKRGMHAVLHERCSATLEILDSLRGWERKLVLQMTRKVFGRQIVKIASRIPADALPRSADGQHSEFELIGMILDDAEVDSKGSFRYEIGSMGTVLRAYEDLARAISYRVSPLSEEPMLDEKHAVLVRPLIEDLERLQDPRLADYIKLHRFFGRVWQYASRNRKPR